MLAGISTTWYTNSVKIINVLRDDGFGEILQIFRQSPAGEVIIVLPKKSRAFTKEDHFAALASEAQSGQKIVSFLTGNQSVMPFIEKFGFILMPISKKEGRPKLEEKEPAQQEVKEDPSAIATAEGEDLLTQLATVSRVDGISLGSPKINISVKQSDQKKQFETVPVRPADTDDKKEDYIDTVWRSRIPTAQSKSFIAPILNGKTPRSFSFKIPIIVAVSALIIFVAVIWLTPGSVTATITPISSPLTFSFSVQSSDEFGAVDFKNKKLPGQFLMIAESAEKTVPASGQRDIASKARGTIIIYNSFSSSPQQLVATTRFVSADSKIFKTLRSVTVPGSSVVSGAIKAGSTQVEVIAEKPGTEYNIPSGKFTIVAFVERKDTERAEKIYGESKSSMTGGASGPSKVVTESDYNSALDGAKASVKEKIASTLAGLDSDFMVFEKDNIIFSSFDSTARPDDAALEVTVRTSGSLETVAIRQTDLTELILAVALQDEQSLVVPEDMSISYSNITFNKSTRILSFAVNIEGIGFKPLDDKEIAIAIAGKSKDQIRNYFSDQSKNIASARTDFRFPFMRKAPSSTSRIQVKFNLVSPN